ncbi:MAG: SpaA isopeptide-forming pilin-related protein [bacterium]
MVKFDLAKKYIAGLLVLAMVLTLGITPLTAAPSPETNASTWSVTLTPTSAPTNPADSGDTHTITIYTKLNGTLADPGYNVYLAVSDGNVIVADPVNVSRTSTGVFTGTLTYGTTVSNPGTYYIYGYIDTDTSTTLSANDIVSDPATKTWEARTASYFVVEPETATNTIGESHTITITVKDQFGDDFFWSGTATVNVTGFNTKEETVTFVSESSTTWTYSSTSPAPTDPNPPYTDQITVTSTFDTETVTKLWTYTANYTSWDLSPDTATNVAGTNHTVTASFFDQYDRPMTISGTITWKVAGVHNLTETTTFSDASAVPFTYTGTYAGDDTITATLTYGGTDYGPLCVTKHWTAEGPTELTLVPEDATNTVGETHTLTANLTDQYGNPIVDAVITFNVSGDHTETGTATTNSSGDAVWSYSETTPGVDNIVASYDGLTSNTVTKTWVPGTPSTETTTIYHQGLTPTTPAAYNMVGENHTVEVFVGDEYGNPIEGLGVDFSVTGANATTGTATTDEEGIATFTWTGANPGIDTITATVNVPNSPIPLIPLGPLTKYWANEWSVGPLEEINSIGTEHTFTVKGAPYGEFTWRLYQNDHGLFKIVEIDAHSFTIVPSVSLPTLYNDTFAGTGVLDEEGSATFTIYSKAPYKYYFEVDFTPDMQHYTTRTVTQTHWEVAKIYAYIVDSEISEPAVNCIASEGNIHTVTTTVYGAYYFNGVWRGPVPIANARVDWTVTWDDAIGRQFVSVTVPGTPDTSTATFFTAHSYTDSDGVATLTYKLPDSLPILISPISEHITAVDNYDEDVLDLNYGTFTQETDKTWYDFPFKVVKYVIGNPNHVLPGVEFMITSGTATYYSTTNTYGAALFYHLPCGDYTVWENVPEGFVGAGQWTEVGSFAVNCEDLANSIPYYPPTGEIHTIYVANIPIGEVGFTKVYYIGETATGLAGAVFTVTDQHTSLTYTATSLADGSVTFSGLEASQAPGVTWFKVEETTVPPGFTGVDPFYFFLDGAGDWNGDFYAFPGGPEVWPSRQVENTYTCTGWIEFTKVNQGQERMVGVEFQVFDEDGNFIYSVYSDSSGQVMIDNLPASPYDDTWYRVHEIVPAGYEPVNDFWFYIPAGGGLGVGFFNGIDGTIVFEQYLINIPIPKTPTGYAEFTKLTYCYKVLPGAEFTVTDVTTNDTFGPFVSDGSGHVLMDNLPASQWETGDTWFKVEETLVPAGYLAVDPFYFFLDEHGAWNGHYYATASPTALEVWPSIPHPYNGGMGTAHWVIDQGVDEPFLVKMEFIPAGETFTFPDEGTVNFDVYATDQRGNPLKDVVVTVGTTFGEITVIDGTTGLDGLAHFSITVDDIGSAFLNATGILGSHTQFAYTTYTWEESPPIAINDLTNQTTGDVATFNPLHLTAWSPKAGTWSVAILDGDGNDVTDQGTLSFTGNPGTALDVTWTPFETFQIPGTYTAVVSLTDGTDTVTDSVDFTLYNFPIKILEVKYFNSDWVEIPGPLTGEPFFVQVTISNWCATGPTVDAFIAIQFAGATNYLGFSFVNDLAGGNTAGGGAQFTLPSGAFTLTVVVWDGPGGSAIALPWSP